MITKKTKKHNTPATTKQVVKATKSKTVKRKKSGVLNLVFSLSGFVVVVGLLLALFIPTFVEAFELYNPASTCNAQQSLTMGTKCEPLSGQAFALCERETLQQFFKCVTGKGVKDGK
ncbi:hypothetical protein KKC13_00815 [bacterium]|nr:hypothetical protein [bacterium]MBU1958936.1 hypothetical protein [bacterium]